MREGRTVAEDGSVLCSRYFAARDLREGRTVAESGNVLCRRYFAEHDFREKVGR